MKRLIIALFATSAMGFALPALAHPEHAEDAGVQQSWNNGGDTYAEFDQEYQHIWDGIQHSLSDGSYTQDQAQSYFRAMQDIRGRADDMQRDGRYNPGDIQARLERLHAVMHQAHTEGHATTDQQGGNPWGSDGMSYAEFNQEYQHIWQGIQHGVNDGSYTRREAQQFYREMQRIRARANWMQRSGRWNPAATQAQLERLHDVMHDAHEEGHDRQDSYSYRR